MKFASKKLFVKNIESKYHHQNQHTWISLDLKCWPKQTILIFWQNLHKKVEKILFMVNNTRIPIFFTYHEIQLLKNTKNLVDGRLAVQSFNISSPVGCRDQMLTPIKISQLSPTWGKCQVILLITINFTECLFQNL